MLPLPVLFILSASRPLPAWTSWLTASLAWSAPVDWWTGTSAGWLAGRNSWWLWSCRLMWNACALPYRTACRWSPGYRWTGTSGFNSCPSNRRPVSCSAGNWSGWPSCCSCISFYRIIWWRLFVNGGYGPVWIYCAWPPGNSAGISIASAGINCWFSYSPGTFIICRSRCPVVYSCGRPAWIYSSSVYSWPGSSFPCYTCCCPPLINCSGSVFSCRSYRLALRSSNPVIWIYCPACFGISCIHCI